MYTRKHTKLQEVTVNTKHQKTVYVTVSDPKTKHQKTVYARISAPKTKRQKTVYVTISAPKTKHQKTLYAKFLARKQNIRRHIMLEFLLRKQTVRKHCLCQMSGPKSFHFSLHPEETTGQSLSAVLYGIWTRSEINRGLTIQNGPPNPGRVRRTATVAGEEELEEEYGG